MTTPAEMLAIVDLAERLQLVYDRNDVFPTRVLGAELREALLGAGLQLDDPELVTCSLDDPTACDPDELRVHTQCLIDTARRWAAARAQDDQPLADR